MPHIQRVVLLLALCVVALPAHAQGQATDWKLYGDEAVAKLGEYIRWRVSTPAAAGALDFDVVLYLEDSR